ncbi:MAG: glycoside hydrolase family 13 protein [Balneolaceae bacterium]
MKYYFSSAIVLLLFASCTPEPQPEKVYSSPEWAKGIVWYQIFPERFRDGDSTNQPNRERARGPEGWEISSWTQDWYQRDDWEKDHTDDFYSIVRERRYGGDLQGVIDKLDYLKDLGVGGIYLNPIFDAQSMHKYDASYFHHIDRNFGPNPEADVAQFEAENPNDPSTWKWTSGDKLFLELIKEAHKRDLKVVIDGVFNHTGTEFWAFKDLVKNQEKSKYKDWYIVNSFDNPETDENEFDYEGWWGFKGLPVFREENENLIDPIKQHIFDITRRWMDPNGDGDPSDGVDGWRLDVAEEVGDNFWIEWHDLVREINPEAITIAEIWTDKAKDYINAEMFTTVMNYRFAYAAKDYFIDERISIAEFENRLKQVEEDYPEEGLDVLQNLMDSHDTARLASIIVNPGLEYDRNGSVKDGFNPRKPNKKERAVQKLVSIFQYTWKGAPMIYYGTESGMWGADDPDDRKPMVWDDMKYEPERIHPLGKKRAVDDNNFDAELHSFYKKLAEIRNQYVAIQKGDVEFLLLDEETGLVVFKRSYLNEPSVYVALNRSEQPLTFAIETCTYTDLMSDELVESENCSQELKIPAVSGRIISIQTN